MEDGGWRSIQPPTSNFQPPTSNFQLPTSNFQLPIFNLQSLVFSLLTGLLILSALGALTLVPQALPGHKEPLSELQINRQGMSEYDYQTALWARLYGGPWLLEYMPAWVTEGREEFFLPLPERVSNRPALSAPQIELQSYRHDRRTLRVQSLEPFTLSFHTFYFPTWQMRVDGQAVPTWPSGPLALVSADVPAGAHLVTLDWEATRLQRIGEWITGLSVALVLGISIWRFTYSTSKLAWLCAAALLSLVALFFVASTRPSDSLRTLNASFDGQIDLLGYTTTRDNYQPGQTLELTLYWFARQSPSEDFKVFVHLDGANGRAGQADAQPGFNFSPTTRWQRGEIIADHYRVKVADNAAPGDYELFTGLYRQRPVQNLRVTSPNAAPGDRVRLGVIHVTR